MTDSLKNLASSVDWSKMVSGADARNAVIGSALGGLLLGGAGLAAERDPEESKYAPVSDALTGALLGGVAGYAVPKGFELFRNSGTLAPDDDRLPTGSTGAGKAELEGLGVGTAVGGGVVAPTVWRAFGKLNERYQNARHAGLDAKFGGLRSLLFAMTRDKHKIPVPGGKPSLLRDWLANLTNGSVHYKTLENKDTILGPLRPLGKIHAGQRILRRVGKYGLAGAGLGYALHKLFGPSSKDNFKN